MFQSNIYKKFLAVVIAIFIVGGGTIAYVSLNNIKLGVTPTPDNPISSELEDQSNAAIENLKKTVANASPDKLVFEDISLDDLQVYPKSWVARNFTALQLENQLISGAEADPDKDGLSNRQEFLYGSNPLKASTYCSVEAATKDEKCPKNDKQMIDANYNPLTGLALEIKKKFKVKKIDKNIAESVETPLSVASDQGFDFPKLYEESRKIDLSKDFSEIKVLTQKDSGEGVLNYYKTRLDILKDFAQDDELSSFGSVYGVLEVQKLDSLLTKYKAIYDKLVATVTPELIADYHRANILVVQKLIKVIENRKTILANDKTETQAEVEASKELAKQMLWAYRNLNDQQVKLQKQVERDYPTNVSSVKN
jgi:hypothetical protein